jgi:hypothetical protein
VLTAGGFAVAQRIRDRRKSRQQIAALPGAEPAPSVAI